MSRISLLALAGLCIAGLLSAVLLLSDQEPAGAGRPVPDTASATSDGVTELPPPRVATGPVIPEAPTGPGERLRATGLAPAVIEGRVVDRAGTPRPDARVSLLESSGSGFTAQLTPTGRVIEVSSDGRFRLTNAPIGKPLALEAADDGSAPTRAPVRPLAAGETRLLGDLVLSAGTTLMGRVTDELGLPLPGAQVELREGVGGGPLLAAAAADQNGDYQLHHLAPRQYALRASAEGHATMESVQAFVLGAAGPTWTVDFELPRAHAELRGVTVDPFGGTVPDVGLRLLLRRQGSSAHFSTQATSDDAGNFALTDLPEGRYDVNVESAHWYLALGLGLHTGPDEQRVQLHRAQSIRGQLAAGGAPVSSYWVTVKPDGRSGARLLGGLSARRGFTSDGGEPRFELEGLRPGSYSLLVEAPGYSATRSQDVIIQEGGEGADVLIPLLVGAVIRGRVAPAREGIVIELREGDWDPSSPLEDAFPTPPLSGLRALTDEDGRYRIEHVPPGTVVVTARSAGLPPTHMRDVTVQEGGEYDLGLIQLSVGGAVIGRVLGPDGRPRGGAKIRLAGDGVHLSTSSDGDGSFHFDTVPAGEYEISAAPASLAEALTLEARSPLTVRPEAEASIELLLSARERRQR